MSPSNAAGSLAKALDRLPLFLAVAYVSLAPLAFPAHTAHDPGRLLQVALLAFVATATLAASWLARPPLPILHRSTAGLAVVALCLLVTSLAQANYSGAAAQELALGIGLVALSLFIGAAARRVDLTPFLATLTLGALLYFSVTGGVFMASMLFQQPLDVRLLHIGFDNPRFFNHCQTLAIPVLAGFSLICTHRGLRIAAVAVVVLQFAWLFLDMARASFVGLAFCIAWALWVGAKALAGRLVSCALAGLGVWGLAFELLPKALDRTWVHFASASELASSHSRDQLAAAALAQVAEHPWLGVGPMQFAALQHAKGAHPHNVYLQWAAELGLPAAVLLIALMALPVWRVSSRLRGRREALPAWAAGFAGAAVAALADAGFSGNFVMPVSQVWIALVFGALIGATAQPAHPVPQSPWPMRAVTAMVLGCQLWLAQIAWQQWHYDPPHIRASGSAPDLTAKPRPRFWQYGWL